MSGWSHFIVLIWRYLFFGNLLCVAFVSGPSIMYSFSEWNYRFIILMNLFTNWNKSSMWIEDIWCHKIVFLFIVPCSPWGIKVHNLWSVAYNEETLLIFNVHKVHLNVSWINKKLFGSPRLRQLFAIWWWESSPSWKEANNGS